MHELTYSFWTRNLPDWRMRLALGELHQLASCVETLVFSNGANTDVDSQSYEEDHNKIATSQ